MYLTAEHPFDSRWGFRVNYTLGKAEAIGGDLFSLDYRRVEDYPRHPSSTDERHRVIVSGIVGLPRRLDRSAPSSRSRPASATRSTTIRAAPASTSARLLLYAGRPPDTFNYKSVDFRIEKIFRFAAQQRASSRSKASTSSTRRTSAATTGDPGRAERQSELRRAVVHGGQQQPSTAVRRSVYVLVGVSRAVRALLLVLSLVAGAAGYVGCAPPVGTGRWHRRHTASSADDERFLEDFSRRTFTFFWEQADPQDRHHPRSIDDRRRSRPTRRSANIGSIASVGFGLSGMCIAAERGWHPRADGHRTRRDDAAVVRRSRCRRSAAGSIISSICEPARARGRASCRRSTPRCCSSGVLTVRRCFADDADVVRYANAIYRRVDFQWMLAGGTTLSHGWKPESGFLPGRWDRYCELMILYAARDRIADAPDPGFVLARVVAAGMTFESYYLHQLVRSALRASVLARMDRFPAACASVDRGCRLVPELGRPRRGRTRRSA